MAATIDGTTGLTAPSGAIFNGIASGTAVASTSGTSIDFTSIPSWVKRITVMFQGVSTSGTSNYIIQIGSGSVTTSGYLGTASSISTAVSSTAFTAGFGIVNGAGAATFVFHGMVTLSLLNSSTYLWTSSGAIAGSDTARTGVTGGSIALGGTLDRVRITTVNGTDTFDAGSINILYE